MSVRSIFISRDKSSIPELVTFAENKGLELRAVSLLRFEAVDFKLEEEYPIIFFGSPMAVRCFLERAGKSGNPLFGAVGKGTAEELRGNGLEVAFTGEGSDTTRIAQEFRNWAAGRKVLFPQSDRSLKTVSSIFPPEQKNDLIVYRTLIEPAIIPASDVYVFTSPSNVEGFLQKNEIPADKVIIAWGLSTQSALNRAGIRSACLKNPSEKELILYLKQNYVNFGRNL